MTVLAALLCTVVLANEPLPKGAIARGQLFNGASVAFTPDGEHIVGRYYNGGCIIFPAAREKIANEDIRKEFEGDCAISDDARWLAIKESERSPVEVFQLPQIKRTASFMARGEPVAISDDGTKVLMRTKDTLTEVLCQTGETARTDKCQDARVDSIRWLSNDMVIYKLGIGSSDPSEVWPLLKAFGRADSIVLPSGENTERARSIAVSQNERVLAVTYSDRHRYRGLVVLYDLKTGSPFKYLPRDVVGMDHCTSFSSTSDLLVVGGSFKLPDPEFLHQGGFRIFDAQKGSLKCWLTHGERSIVSASFSADDSRLVTSSALGEIIVWDVAELLGHQ